MPKIKNLLATLGLVCLFGSLEATHAMMVNLARPYTPGNRTNGMVFVAPNHDNFFFEDGTDPKLVCIPVKRALALKWTLSHNMVTVPLATGSSAVRPDNSFEVAIPQNLLVPGFYNVGVEVTLSGSESLNAYTTFGWKPKEMPVKAEQPKDFAEFWKNGLAKLDKIAPEIRVDLEKVLTGAEIDAYNVSSAALPENYDPEGVRYDKVEIYRVHYASYGGKTIEGWFAKPVGKGPFPGLLVLPGAGNNARPAPVEHARHGYAALDIQVYGNPVDAPHYDPVPKEEPPTRTEDISHYGIYLHALQGARVLKQLPGVDKAKVAVLGGSQGGRLTVVVAALDHDMKAAIPAIAHFAYIPWLHWTQEMKTTKSSGGKDGFPGVAKTGDIDPVTYLDVVNFAPLVRCPVYMNMGLTDPVSPATGVYAIYTQLTCPKTLVPLPNTGHDWSPAFDRSAWKWLANVLEPSADAAAPTARK